MKSISKADKARRVELRDAITAAHAALEDACSVANVEIAKANEALAAYREAVQAAVNFVEDIGNEIESYMDDRSDKWRESDAASDYEEWKSAWQNFQPDEPEDYADLEAPEEAAADALDELPETPN
jgi:hypothetical protein